MALPSYKSLFIPIKLQKPIKNLKNYKNYRTTKAYKNQRRLSSTLSTGAFIQRTVFKLSSLLFHCLFVFPAADSV